MTAAPIALVVGLSLLTVGIVYGVGFYLGRESIRRHFLPRNRRERIAVAKRALVLAKDAARHRG